MISSKIISIEGYSYAAILTDDCSGYRWEYVLKTKDEMLDAAKQWYADIAELRQKYTLMVVMRDNAGENTSKAINDFFTEKGVGNFFTTLYEPWQSMTESSIKSIMLLAKTEIAQSGLVGRFWYSTTDFGRACQNATYKQRLGTTPHA